MAEDLKINKEGEKAARYEELLPQLEGLLSGEDDRIANLGNICAALKEAFDWLWVGFYLKRGDELVLGPFQGPVACTRIAMGRGVCGAAAAGQETLIVPDVDKFPGHIACSSRSKSEIVVPWMQGGELVGVLDVDAEELDGFDKTDQKYLEQILLLVK